MNSIFDNLNVVVILPSPSSLSILNIWSRWFFFFLHIYELVVFLLCWNELDRTFASVTVLSSCRSSSSFGGGIQLSTSLSLFRISSSISLILFFRRVILKIIVFFSRKILFLNFLVDQLNHGSSIWNKVLLFFLSHSIKMILSCHFDSVWWFLLSLRLFFTISILLNFTLNFSRGAIDFLFRKVWYRCRATAGNWVDRDRRNLTFLAG